MKKKVWLAVLSLCLLVFIGGCKKQDIADNLDQGNTSDADADTDTDGKTTADGETAGGAIPEEAPVKEAYTASDYVTLGQYKGIEVTVQKLEVTEANLQSAIDAELSSNAADGEVTDRPVQNGDTVNIDFEGLIDGVAFDGGTAQGYKLVIGSGSFIPGFEEGLVGANIGDKLALDLTFPDNYDPELAGKAVTFNVTVNSFTEKIIPELTEDYVKNNTDYDSIAAYKEAKRQELEEQNADTMEQDKINSLLGIIIDNAAFSSIPQNLIDFYAYSYKAYNEQMVYYALGITLEDYLTQINMTEEEFDSNILSVAENYAKAELVRKAIAEAEGIQITEADYQELIPQYLTDNGLESEEVLQQYEAKEQTIENMLLNKAMDFMVDQAVVTETAEATPTVAPTAAP
jgi:trigger factor